LWYRAAVPVKHTEPIDLGVATLSVDTLSVEVNDGDERGKRADGETVSVGTAPGNDLVLSDETVSRYHVELEARPEGVWVSDPGSTNGVYLGDTRIERAMVPAGSVLRLGRSLLRVSSGGTGEVTLHGEDRLGPLLGCSHAMRRLMAQVRRAAMTHAGVLLIGESGTGKELIARLLHDLGPRTGKPFVTVDCASLSPNLVASELFGHERGAFTGADRQHQGAFERASGGTLFLDEIGELPPELTPNLLGALERRRFRRVGGREDVEVDVRVVAATHRDLRAEVNDGRFRLDLYYRLAVVRLAIPALRERADDLPLLIEHFLREAGSSSTPAEVFGAEALSQLRAHHWPGNVRELRNVVEATLAMGEAQLPEGVANAVQALDADAGLDLTPLLALSYKEARASWLEIFERRYLAHRLEATGGNVAAAAREADMDRSHLFHLIRRHGLR